MLASRSRRQRRPGPAVEDGVVLSQSPPGGTRAKPNSVVRIVISNVQRSPDAGASSNCTAGLLSVPSPRLGL